LVSISCVTWSPLDSVGSRFCRSSGWATTSVLSLCRVAGVPPERELELDPPQPATMNASAAASATRRGIRWCEPRIAEVLSPLGVQ
jgi:hypothetical protein